MFSPENGWTTGAQKCSSLIAVLIMSSSRRMDWGMKCSGLMPQTVAVNAVNASCEIILLLWNFGSGVYFFRVHLLPLLDSAECPFGPIWLVLSSVLVILVNIRV